MSGESERSTRDHQGYVVTAGLHRPTAADVYRAGCVPTCPIGDNDRATTTTSGAGLARVIRPITSRCVDRTGDNVRACYVQAVGPRASCYRWTRPTACTSEKFTHALRLPRGKKRSSQPRQRRRRTVPGRTSTGRAGGATGASVENPAVGAPPEALRFVAPPPDPP